MGKKSKRTRNAFNRDLINEKNYDQVEANIVAEFRRKATRLYNDSQTEVIIKHGYTIHPSDLYTVNTIPIHDYSYSSLGWRYDHHMPDGTIKNCGDYIIVKTKNLIEVPDQYMMLIESRIALIKEILLPEIDIRTMKIDALEERLERDDSYQAVKAESSRRARAKREKQWQS